ncbi:MAG: type II CAAX endopeptidase family protein [Atribacterota bacterium]|jgi:membrane protease YdiL (CAAX protease family)|nr:type II CAAX endopeptidase family protein [Atribacterota bacterium]MDD5637311.1 type II CAAX endopeptidase family protein [Atribacterota bacterium]
MNKKTKKAIIFIGLTLSLSYLLVFIYFSLGGKWIMPGSLIIATTYMFIPMLAAIIVQKVMYKESIKEPLGISFKLNRWFFIAWLLPIIIAFMALGISLFLPTVEYSPELAGFYENLESTLSPEQIEKMKAQAAAFPVHPLWIAVLQALIAGITINAVAGFGEELGWRGLLQKELAHLGFWKSSICIGLIWGLWHAPLILQGHNYPSHPQIGVIMMVIFILLLSPILSYIRLKAKSVIAAAILHGSLNATFGIPLMVIKGGNDLTVGITGLAGFVALALANLGLLIYDRYFSLEKIMNNKSVKI